MNVKDYKKIYKSLERININRKSWNSQATSKPNPLNPKRLQKEEFQQ